MRTRRALNVVAGVFLVGVAVLIISIGKSLSSDPEAIDTSVLVGDLDAFTAPPGSRPAPVVVLSECTGEGSYPASAERRFVVDGSLDDATANVNSQALDTGWGQSDAHPGALVRDDRVLNVASEDTADGPPTVIVRVETSNYC